MQTTPKIIKRWATLLAMIGSMAAMPLMAQTPLNVPASTTVTESGTAYSYGYIDGSYSGSNVSFTSGPVWDIPNGSPVLTGVHGSGSLALTSSTLTLNNDGSYTRAIFNANPSSALMLDNVVLNITNANGISIQDQGSNSVYRNVTINENSAYDASTGVYSHGLVLFTTGSVTLQNLAINTNFVGQSLVLAGNSSSYYDIDGYTLNQNIVMAPASGSSTLYNWGIVATAGAFNARNITINQSIQKNGYAYADSTDGVYYRSPGVSNIENLKITIAGDSTYANGIRSGAGVLNVTNADINVSSSNANIATGNLTGVSVWSSTVNILGANNKIEVHGKPGIGVFVNSHGVVTAENLSVTTDGNSGYGIYATATSQFTGTNLTVSTTGNSSHGVYITNSSTAAITGATINTAGNNAYGVYATNANTSLKAGDVTVETQGNGAHAAYATHGASLELNNFSLTTHGDRTLGLVADGYDTAVGSLPTATDTVVRASNGSITTYGDYSYGAYIGNSGITNLYLTDVAIQTHGQYADGLRVSGGINGDKTAELTRVAIDAPNASAISLNRLPPGGIADIDRIYAWSSTYHITLTDSVVSGSQSLYVASVRSGTDSSGAMQTYDVPTNLTLTANNTQMNGDVFVDSGTSVSNVSLNQNSVLTGKSTKAAEATLNIAIDNSSRWIMTGDSNLTDLSNNGLVQFKQGGAYKTLTVEGNWTGSGTVGMSVNLSTATIGGTGDGDKIILSGSSSGSQTLAVKNVGGGKLNTALDVVHRQGTDNTETFTLAGGTIDGGAYKYALALGDAISFDSGTTTLDANTWYLYNTGSESSGSGGGKTVALTPQLMWFAEQDTLLKRMGELRLDEGIFSDKGVHDWQVWVRSYGSQYNVGGKATGTPFNASVYGVDIGADKAWNLDKRNVLYTGIYGGYGSTDQNLRGGASGSGGSDAYLVGAYATWLHDTGWYADLVGKGQYFDNNFNTYDNSGTRTGANYGQWAAGVSLELGRQFQFKDGWYAEPQVQASYMHGFGANYQTSGNVFGVNLNDADVLQLRFGSLFGRTIKFENSKQVIQPYVKIFGMEQVSDGGEYTTEAGTTRPNLDGPAAVIGCGIVWQLDEVNQLHLDYEAAFANKYDKPFGINFGYRHQF